MIKELLKGKKLQIYLGAVFLLLAIIAIKTYLNFRLSSIGHDYSWVLPTLIEQKNFILKNGLFSVDLYAPNFCGGMLGFANPNNFFYSIPAAIFIYFDFISFERVLYLSTISIASIGTYFVARNLFQFSVFASIIGAIIIGTAEIYSVRIYVGHVKYFNYCFFPVFVYLVNAKISENLIGLFNFYNLLGVIVLALIIYGASADLIPPLIYTSVLTAILMDMNGDQHLLSRIKNLTFVMFFGVLISLFKIIPGALLMSNFPRDNYSGALVHADAFYFIKNFFISVYAPVFLKLDTQLGPSSKIGSWELLVGLGFCALILTIIGFNKSLKRLFLIRSRRLLCIWIFLPLLLFISNPLYIYIKSFFIFSFYTHYLRYWMIYFPLFLYFILCGVESIAQFKRKLLVFTVLFLSILFGFDKLYTYKWLKRNDIKWDNVVALEVINYSNALSIKNPLPEIKSIEFVKNYNWNTSGVMRGTSVVNCYETIFGYNREKLKVQLLHEGSIFDLTNGKYNFFDPDCYLRGNKKNCSPGDLVAKGDEAKLHSMLKYEAVGIDSEKIYKNSFLVSLISFSIIFFVTLFRKLYHHLKFWKS